MNARIVREGNDSGWLTSNKARGYPYLALPWPEDCPYTPERFLEEWPEACGVPVQTPASGAWLVPLRDHPCASGPHWKRCWPEFIGEPKKCKHDGTRVFQATLHEPEQFSKCLKCGAILSDRRHETHRKGERREEERRSFKCGGRRNHGSNPRRCKDRRQP